MASSTIQHVMKNTPRDYDFAATHFCGSLPTCIQSIAASSVQRECVDCDVPLIAANCSLATLPRHFTVQCANCLTVISNAPFLPSSSTDTNFEADDSLSQRTCSFDHFLLILHSSKERAGIPAMRYTKYDGSPLLPRRYCTPALHLQHRAKLFHPATIPPEKCVFFVLCLAAAFRP